MSNLKKYYAIYNRFCCYSSSNMQAWDWVFPLKTEICLSSGAAVSLLGGFGGMLPQEIFFNRYSLLQSGSIKIHMYCTRKKS